MKKILQHVAEFERDGVTLIKNVLCQSLLDELTAGVDQNLAMPTSRGIDYVRDDKTGERFFHDAMLVDTNPHYKKVIFESRLGELVAGVMQSQAIAISNITVFLRSVGTQKRTRWHRDQPYWPALGKQACSTWIPLDPVSAETSLEFVRGSHHWEDKYLRADFRETKSSQHLSKDTTRKEPFPDIEANRDQYDILSFDVQPGDCILFHGMTTHGGSGRLPAGLQRRTVSFQWFGDDIRFMPREGGVDPDFLKAFADANISPGMPIMGPVCPQVWPR